MKMSMKVPQWLSRYRLRILIAILAGLLAMSAVGASAAGLGTVTPSGLGTSTQITAACLTSGQITVVWNGAAYVAGASPTYTVDTVTIGAYGTTCRGKSYKFVIADGAGTAIQSFSGTVPNTTSFALSLSPVLNAASAKQVTLVIYE